MSTSLPVTSSPHAAAFTNSDGLRPTCARQSPWPILSRMRRSRVAASGMRSSASARHMSAMPSRESSENSSISASTPPGPGAVRRARLRPAGAASACVTSSASGASAASAISGAIASASGRRWSARIRSRNGKSSANAAPVAIPTTNSPRNRWTARMISPENSKNLERMTSEMRAGIRGGRERCGGAGRARSRLECRVHPPEPPP